MSGPGVAHIPFSRRGYAAETRENANISTAAWPRRLNALVDNHFRQQKSV